MGVEGEERLPVDEAFASHRPLDTLWAELVQPGEPDVEQRILFVSPEHGAGTTTLAACAALGLARNLPEPIALVETNCFTPALAGYLDLPPAPGITDVLDGSAEITEAIRNSLVPRLHVLTGGTRRPVAQGELVSPRVRRFLEQAAIGHRFTILDAPPIVEHPETRLLLGQADRVVLVLRARSTEKQKAQTAVRMIEDAGVPILGAILNRYQSDLPFGLGIKAWE